MNRYFIVCVKDRVDFRGINSDSKEPKEALIEAEKCFKALELDYDSIKINIVELNFGQAL